MELIDPPELGILNLALVPAQNATFCVSPARSLHAAVLRRLELIDPELSKYLHDSSPGAHSTEHPLAVSALAGPIRHENGLLVAPGDQTYRARVAALTSEVAKTLDLSFNPKHPLGREPLILEHVPFHVLSEETYWDNLTTYASLLTMAKPQRRIALEFLSPTGFKSRLKPPPPPDPSTCILGYLRKWNAFSGITLPEEPLLEYVKNHMRLGAISVHPAAHRLGKFSEYGFVGTVEWESEGGAPALLRQVNALVDFACYCGTGMKTALGMGQTRRLGIEAERAVNSDQTR